MAKPIAQYFIGNGKKTPFYQFLINEKEKRQCSWKKLSEICGVNKLEAYVMANTKGEPNRPPHEKFLKIIHALEYPESSFKVELKVFRGQGENKFPKRSYPKSLKILGEGILQITQKSTHPQKLSVPIIKLMCGNSFYLKHAKTPLKRQKLHQDLIELEPKFKEIELQHQEQRRIGVRPIEKFEEEIIETSLLNYVERNGQFSNERLPHGTYSYVLNELNSMLQKAGIPQRTHSSIAWYINKYWKSSSIKHAFVRGSPITSPDIIEKIFEERIEEIDEIQHKTPKKAYISKVLLEKDIDNHKRELYRNYSHIGHTNLVLFLMEPKNYLEHISKDIELFDIDFNENESDDEIKEYYKEKIELLKTRKEELPDELGVIEFIDSWLRCDIIFTRNGGGFVIVEIKQYAQDKKTFKNGTKACQQLVAYSAVILDNILRHNIANTSTSTYTPIKEYVEGCLVAYDIEKSIMNHLNRSSNKRPIIIPKQIVDDYIIQLHLQKSLEPIIQ